MAMLRKQIILRYCFTVIASLCVIGMGVHNIHADGSPANTISTVFQSGNPDLLESCMAEKDKVFVSIPAAGVSPGNYSRNQLTATFRQMFHRLNTESFSFTGDQKGGPLRASWSFKELKTGRTRQTTLYFTISQNQLRAIRGEQ